MEIFFLSPVPLRTAHTEKLHQLRHLLQYRETIPKKRVKDVYEVMLSKNKNKQGVHARVTSSIFSQN